MNQPPVQRLSFDAQSILLLNAIYVVLSLRLDGWGHADQTILQQTGLLPFTFLFVGLIAVCCLRSRDSLFNATPERWLSVLARLSLFHLACGLCFMLQALSITIVVIEAVYFQRLGYVLNLPAIVGAGVLSALALGIAAKAAAARLLIASAFCYMLLAAYSIVFFPLTTMRSDCLPLIEASCRSLLSGHSPYGLYHLASGDVPLTYLPLTWIAYLPATILHLDIRWTNLALTLAVAVIIYRSVPLTNRLFASCILSGFVLLPFDQYHHEIYISPQWVCFAMVFALCQRQRWILAAVAMGLGTATSQLFWIVTPFFLLFLFSKKGLRYTALAAVLMSLAAAIFFLPFVLFSRQQFLSGILTHWGEKQGVEVRSYNLTFWINTALAHVNAASFRNLQRVQGAALVVLFLFALRRRIPTQADLWRWAAAAITLFALTNFLVRPYIYSTALFALAIAMICASEEREAHPDLQTATLTS